VSLGDRSRACLAGIVLDGKEAVGHPTGWDLDRAALARAWCKADRAPAVQEGCLGEEVGRVGLGKTDNRRVKRILHGGPHHRIGA